MGLTIEQHIAGATMTRAMQLARGAVKAALHKQAVRLCEVDAKTISSWAVLYLEDHPKLIAEAKTCVEAWFARGVFGKKAQKAFIKHRGTPVGETESPRKSEVISMSGVFPN
jgi:putative methionine-R-sulfoxide reductase with GAF domain